MAYAAISTMVGDVYMTSALRISLSQLKSSDLTETGVHKKLFECLKSKACLHVDLHDTYITLTVDSIFPNDSKNIEIFGDWRSSAIDGRCRSKGAQILSLYLFNFSRISIPYSKIKTMGRKGRSIADLVLRNVFYSILRGERVYYSRGSLPVGSKLDESCKIFLSNYTWIIKAFFKSNSLSGTDLNEKIIYATHLGISVFKDNFLDHGVKELYQVAVAKTKDRDRAEVSPAEFKKFRNKILSHLK